MAKPGKRKGKPAHKRYNDENHRLKRKQRNVARSSHEKWTYEDLTRHQQEIEKNRPRPKVDSKKKKGK